MKLQFDVKCTWQMNANAWRPTHLGQWQNLIMSSLM